jgi:hypothetical protein
MAKKRSRDTDVRDGSSGPGWESHQPCMFSAAGVGVSATERKLEKEERGKGGQCALRDKPKCYRLTPAESHNSGGSEARTVTRVKDFVEFRRSTVRWLVLNSINT